MATKNHVLLKTPIPSNWEPEKFDATGSATTESWLCIDCGVNTAPGFRTRAEIERDLTFRESSRQTIDNQSEVYAVRNKVWAAAGLEFMGGCLCVGCLERRIGRRLVPKDFIPGHPFNDITSPGTPRLIARREGLTKWAVPQPDGSFKVYQVAENGEVEVVVGHE